MGCIPFGDPVPIVEIQSECLLPDENKKQHHSFVISKVKARRFFEIFNATISELERVELCPEEEAKEYESDQSWPMTEAV